jgi:prepilin-type processing-associated H-X9-DG protein
LRSHGEEVAEALEARRSTEVKSLTEQVRTAGGSPRALDPLIALLKEAKIVQRDREVAASANLSAPEALASIALDGIEFMHSAGNRTMSQNNLKQIALAMHNYHDVNGMMPSCLRDKNGKPLLSWRVAILPYIEQDNLFRQFKLDEPWDSEHNKKLIANMPKIYELPGERAKHELPSTHYRVFVGNGAAFDLTRDTSMAQITDGLSNMIMAVEAADAVPWTKPEEIEYAPKKPPKLAYRYAGRANIVMCDGAVHTIRKSLPERTLHLLIQRADNQPIPPFDD